MKKDKRLRSFYCDDALWIQAVEHADTQGVDIDEMIEDAIRTFIEKKQANEEDISTQQYHRSDIDDVVYGRREEFAAEDTHPDSTTKRVHKDEIDAHTSPPPNVADALSNRGEGKRPVLTMKLEDRDVEIDTDRFVIGRSSKGTDFVIRDENVSRKHCAILYHAGQFYMQDLQSTNGTEYNGKQIDLRRIHDGDAYHICDYEMSFELQRQD